MSLISISSITISHAQISNLGSNKTGTASVTNASASVTLNTAIPSHFVGRGGYQISLNGVIYEVLSTESTTAITLNTVYAGSTNASRDYILYPAVELRLYILNNSFTPNGTTIRCQMGAPGSAAFYKRVCATVRPISGVNSLIIPSLTLYSTADIATTAERGARYSAWFHRLDGSRISAYAGYESFALDAAPTSTDWTQIAAYNRPSISGLSNNSSYNTEQINALLAANGGISATPNYLLKAGTSTTGTTAAAYETGGNIVVTGSQTVASALDVGGAASIGGNASITGAVVNSGLLHSQIASQSYAAGTFFTTAGFTSKGDGGEATYRVSASLGSNTADGYGAITLANGNYAIMMPQFGGRYNGLAFGAIYHASTDSTTAVQRAHDFQSLNCRTGEVYFPENLDTSKYINITTVYVNSGNHILGAGRNSLRTGALTTSRYGTRFKVLSGGKGFVIGMRSHSDLNQAINASIRRITIFGSAGAHSGIRLGSDVSYKGPALDGLIEDCEIRDFTSSGVTQTVYDKSTVAFGSADADYYGTFAITGAAGIFIANTVNFEINRTWIEGNYYGIAESSGGKSTTLTVRKSYISQNTYKGVYFTSIKSVEFVNGISEGNEGEAMVFEVPVTATTELRSQMYGIHIKGWHFEQNNLQRRTSSGNPYTYTIDVRNLNAGAQIPNVYIDSAVSSAYGHGIRFARARNASVSKKIDVATGDTLITATDSEACFYTDEVQSTGVMDVDTGFTILRNTLGATHVATSAAVSGTTTINLSEGAFHTVTMGAGNTTFTATKLRNGQLVSIVVVQDATGSRTITWDSTFKNGSSAMDIQPFTGANSRTQYFFQSDGTALRLIGVIPDGDTPVFNARAATLANKTLTAPTINSPTMTAPVLGVATATSLNAAGFISTTPVTANTSTAYAVNCASSNVFILTLNGVTPAMTVSNLVAGQEVTLMLIQDGSGSRVPSWSANFKFTGGTAPTLTTAAGSVDMIKFVSNGTNLYEVSRALDVK